MREDLLAENFYVGEPRFEDNRLLGQDKRRNLFYLSLLGEN